MPDKIKWAGFAFTPEEDLILLSGDGLLFHFDVSSGMPKTHKPEELGMEFLKDNIIDLRLEGTMLIFRTYNNNFYYKDVLEVGGYTKFDSVRNLGGNRNTDYLSIPKNVSGSGELELLVTDPSDGFHLIKESNFVHVTNMQ